MRLKIIILFVVGVLTGCEIESHNCPKMIEVPFEKVSIPDSVKAHSVFTIDVKLHDYGCYQNADAFKSINCDTIYLSALANYDECGCPSKSKDLELQYVMSLDAASHNYTKYFVYYYKVDERRDSIRLCVDTLHLY